MPELIFAPTVSLYPLNVELTPEMADVMNAAYLKETVGPYLTTALTKVIVDQPDDAVEYIGRYLLDHVAQVDAVKAATERFAALTEAAARCDALREDEVRKAAKTELDFSSDEEALIQQLLEGEGDVQSVLNGLTRTTGATTAYLGEKTLAADGTEVVVFFLPSEEQKSCFLKGPEDGVTFDLFQERETYEAELGAADEALSEADAALSQATSELEALGDEDDKTEKQGAVDALQAQKAGALLKKAAVRRYPASISIDNVVREPRVKFFGIPRIGGYAAFAVRYETALHEDGLTEEEDDSFKFKPVEKIIACHTMGGTSFPFTNPALEKGTKWAEALAKYLETTEKTKARTSKAARKQVAEKADELKAQLDAFDKEAEEPQVDESASEAQKELAKQQVKCEIATKALKLCVPTLQVIAEQDSVPPPKPVLHIFAAALGIFGGGVSSQSLQLPGTDLPSWPLIASHLTTLFAADLDAIPATLINDATTSSSSRWDLTTLKTTLEDASAANFYAAEPLARLLAWVQHLITLGDHAKVLADAAAEEAKQSQADADA